MEDAKRTRETAYLRIKSIAEARNLSLREVEAGARIGTGTIDNWSPNKRAKAGKNVLPRMDTLSKIADFLGTNIGFLMGASEDSTPDVRVAPAATPPAFMHRIGPDVPILGTAAGSAISGAFQIEGGVVDYVPRPHGLMHATEAYALYVEGSSMEPQYFPGDIIFINPRKKPRQGDIVVVEEKHYDSGPSIATLGIWLRMTEKFMILGKRHGEKAEVSIDRAKIKEMYRVVPTNEAFGA